HDLVVQQRIGLAVRVGGRLGVEDLRDAQSRGGELAKTIEAIGCCGGFQHGDHEKDGGEKRPAVPENGPRVLPERSATHGPYGTTGRVRGSGRAVRPALPVIDRYILQELGSPFGLGLALFILFLVIDRLYPLTDLVITKGVPFHLVLQLLVFTLPSFMAQTLAMAFLVAVLLAGGRLAGDREIIAFKSAGVSIVRLFRPVLL